jgi:hypothetical protein
MPARRACVSECGLSGLTGRWRLPGLWCAGAWRLTQWLWRIPGLAETFERQRQVCGGARVPHY